MSNSSTLPILMQENINDILASTPEAYSVNTRSVERCNIFGNDLLSAIQTSGMTDDLDRKCADYIDKTKRTLKAMNERRAPITKIFDRIRCEFTALEAQIDPGKPDTPAALVQAARNIYAAKKREEAERQRREEMARQQRAMAISRYTDDISNYYHEQFDRKVQDDLRYLSLLNESLTLENFDKKAEQLRSYSNDLSKEWLTLCLPASDVKVPAEITEQEADKIRRDTLRPLVPVFREQYATEIGDYRDAIVDTLPARIKELEQLAKASAEEKARLEAQIKEREAAERQRKEEERQRKEEEAKANAKAKETAKELGNLFNAVDTAQPAYCPKTSVKKHINFINPEGVLAAVMFWWSKEGRFYSVEDLSKIFKRMITYCDKCANDKDHPEFITSPFVHYDEEIKAK